MVKIKFEKTLEPSEFKYKLIDIPIRYRNEFPPANEPFIIKCEGEDYKVIIGNQGRLRRYDLPLWFNRHSNMTNGSIIRFTVDNETKSYEIEIVEIVTTNGDMNKGFAEPNGPTTREYELENFLAEDLSVIESGLELISRQLPIETGRLDLLAKDLNGNLDVIELKVRLANEAALGQLLGDMACVQHHIAKIGQTVHGILVAPEFNDRVLYASRYLPNVQLKRLSVHFSIENVSPDVEED